MSHKEVEDSATAVRRGRRVAWEGSRQIGRWNWDEGLAAASMILKMLGAGADTRRKEREAEKKGRGVTRGKDRHDWEMLGSHPACCSAEKTQLWSQSLYKHTKKKPVLMIPSTLSPSPGQRPQHLTTPEDKGGGNGGPPSIAKAPRALGAQCNIQHRGRPRRGEGQSGRGRVVV